MPKHKAETQEFCDMSEKVHYEDNLFYLLTDITRLKNGLKLSIDKDFFFRKTTGGSLFYR